MDLICECVTDEFVFSIINPAIIVYHLLQTFLCYEQPQDHPFISDEEKEYLKQKIEHYEYEGKNKSSTPWMAIAQSSPVWALVLSTVTKHFLSLMCDV